jgi:threonine dehydrogenase-like Zn-dependent dehydrogenase
MKAAVWTAEGVLELKDVTKPRIEKPNMVLARVKASGICGSDLNRWRVSSPERIGRITGHELAGKIVDIGDNVTNVRIGDRVAIESLVECHQCRWCKSGLYHLCPDMYRIRSETLSRGFSEYVAGPSEKFIKLKDHVKLEWASLLDCYAVNVHAFNVANTKMYETIVVFGQGPMGLSMTDLGNAMGLKVVAIALRDQPLQTASRLGAWATINSKKVEPIAKVKELTGGIGADAVFLQVGGKNPNPTIDALKMTKPRGKVMVIGSPTGGNVLKEFDTNLLRGERILQYVNNFGYWNEYSENLIALDYMNRGRLNPGELITHRFPLERIVEAFDTAYNKKATEAIKVIITQK